MTACASPGGTWTSSNSRPGCTPQCHACTARAAARPRRSACRGRARAAALPCCSKPWRWRCARTCRWRRRPASCVCSRTGCGGASSTTWSKRARLATQGSPAPGLRGRSAEQRRGGGAQQPPALSVLGHEVEAGAVQEVASRGWSTGCWTIAAMLTWRP